jgi:putative redox protein
MQVQVAIKIEGNLTDEQRAELLREADHCYVHRMIKGEWDISEATTFTETT